MQSAATSQAARPVSWNRIVRSVAGEQRQRPPSHFVRARLRVFRLLVALALSPLSCGTLVPRRTAPAPTIAGDWRSHSGRRVLDMSISVRGTNVDGEGELRDPVGQTVHIVVRGEYTPPALRLQFFSHDQMLMTYVAHLGEGDTLRGVLEDSGAKTDSLFFYRLVSGF